MKELIKSIGVLVPENEQEENDRRLILQYMNRFPDILSRENELVHMTTSGWIVNEDRSKVLMIYHNIFHSWAWVGGHADGDPNLLEVVKREIQEETGIRGCKLLSEDIFGLSIQVVKPHRKRGKYLSSHLHCDVQYLFEASENEALRMKPDENSGVAWLETDTLLDKITEDHMLSLYDKLIKKVKRLSI